MSNKTLQERLAEARQTSPINALNEHQISLRVSNSLKKGTSTGKVTPGAFRQGQSAWNKGKTHTPEQIKKMSDAQKGKTRGPRSAEIKEKQSNSATTRWAKQHKRVSCQGIAYLSIYEAGDALGIHKDTVLYRIKTKPKEYYYI